MLRCAEAVRDLGLEVAVVTPATPGETARAARDAGLDAEVNLGGGMAVDYRDPGTRFDWPAYGAGLRRRRSR